ncbi:hypothetical protein MKW94_026296 [Papaver nudicaule]|uniref:Uncharacterized protein n=1 Tax=Papaver nudicaule TaxID=74823 RepID=A0AA41VXT3_PAPNU|nr:hypothetical protein [Papaver nudicaule]
MAKMSVFLCFFLFVLIAMPSSSSSRMMLGVGVDLAVGTTKSCPPEECTILNGCPPEPSDGNDDACPALNCPNGVQHRCCDCPTCC